MFTTKPIVRCLALAFGGMASTMMLVEPSSAQQDTQRLDRVEVTGSAIKRIEGETALPLTIITRQEIERSGVSDVAELVLRLTANNGQGYNLANALGDAARPGFSGASLRGLGPNSTLILLNGRRLAVYAFDGGAVNLQQIPFSAIERVEVLRDGASAIYGSDAIGGVINFITRKDYRGVTARGGVAIPTGDGDGEIYNASITGGWGDLSRERFNIFATLNYVEQKSLKAKDRDFAKSALRRDIEQDPDQTGSTFGNRLSSNAFPGNILTPAGAFRNPYAPAFSGGNASQISDPILGLFTPGCEAPISYDLTGAGTRCRYDYASQIDIIPENKVISLLSRLTFQLTPDTQLFAEGSYARQKAIFRISQTPASEATTHTQPDGTTLPLLYPAGGPFYPGNGIVPAIPGTPLTGDLNMYWRSVELGPRTNEVTTDEYRALVGLQGLIAGWDYNVATYYTVSKAVENYLGGYILESKLLPAFFTGLINPFARNTGAGADLLRSTQITGDVREAKLERTAIDGTVSRDVAQLPAGPLGLALGAQFYKDKYKDNPSPILGSSDIIGGAGEQPVVEGKRDVYAVFGEVNVPILKSLSAQFAARYDHYSDFGSTTNPKVGLRWQPSTQLLLRASAGTGFRAPTLPDVISPPARTNSGGVYNDPFYDAQVGCDPDTGGVFDPKYCGAQLSVTNSGNKTLQPEESKQFSVGFVVEPTRDISIGVDYWWIKQTDLIGFPGGDNILSDCVENFDPVTLTCNGPLSSRIRTRVANGITVIDTAFNEITNVGNQFTRGFDFQARLRFPGLGLGNLTFGWDGTYIASQKFKFTIVPNQDYTQGAGSYTLFGPVVRWKHILSTTLERGPWTGSVFYNYQNRYEDQYNAANGSQRKVGSYDTFDLFLRWNGIRNLSIFGGVRNLFDRDPPKTNQNSYFQVGYDPTYVDPRGRTPYINVEYKFF